MFAVGMPSSRPRLSPSTTSPSNRNGPPRNSRRRRHLAGGHEAADVASRRPSRRPPPRAAPRASRTRVATRSMLRVALGALAEAEVLADRDLLRAQLLHQDLLDELLGAALGEVAVERDHHELLHAEPGDQVALDRERVSSFGQRVGVDDGERVRVEGEHRVAAADHLAVAEVHAVEGPDRHAPAAVALGRRSGSGVTFIARRTLRTGCQLRPRGSAIASSRALVGEPHRALFGRPGQAAARGRPRSPRRRPAGARAGSRAPRSSGTSRSWSASSSRKGPIAVRSSSSQ